MQKQEVNILIIDDYAIKRDFDIFLQGLSDEYNFKIHLPETFAKVKKLLAEFKKENKVFDIISTDVHFENSDFGNTDLGIIYNLIKENKPKKLFLHSGAEIFSNILDKDEHAKSGFLEPIGKIRNTDFGNISGKFLEPELIGHKLMMDHDFESELLKYLIENYKIKFPATLDEFQKLVPPEKKETIFKYTKPEESEKDFKKILKESLFSNNSDLISWQLDAEIIDIYNEMRIKFSEFIGSPLTGVVAFSLEDAEKLKNEGNKVILLTQDPHLNFFNIQNKVDGIVLLKKGTAHFKNDVKTANFPTLINPRSEIKITKLKHIEGYKIEFDAENIVIRNGAQISICPHHHTDKKNVGSGILSNAKYISCSIDWNIQCPEQILQASKEIRAENGSIKILANANNAEQINRAFENGADGIGLVRTEKLLDTSGKTEKFLSIITQQNYYKAKENLFSIKEDLAKSFTENLKACKNAGDKEITIRFLDFNPTELVHKQTDIDAIKTRFNVDDIDKIRGTNLYERMPSLFKAQAYAICDALKNSDYKGELKLLLPYSESYEAYRVLNSSLHDIFKERGVNSRVNFVPMVENLNLAKDLDYIKKIALEHGEIALGLNDLMEQHVSQKMDKKVLRNDYNATAAFCKRHNSENPFQGLCAASRELIENICEAARSVNPNVNIKICGAQVAARYDAMEFCQKNGVDISIYPDLLHLGPAQIFVGKAAALHPKPKYLPDANINNTEVLNIAARKIGA